MISRRKRAWVPYVLILPFVIFAVFPLYWMLITSLKTNAELYGLTSNPFLITKGVTFQHFRYLFAKTHFVRWYINSVIVSTVATGISVVVSTMAGYSLARLKFKGSEILGMAIFVAYLIPPTLLFIPMTRVVASLGLGDRLVSLIITYPTFLVPFCTWLIMSYFATIPRELEECAMVDGATRFQAMRKIILPISLPGVVTVTLFSFTLSWGELIYALSFISSTLTKTLPIGLKNELIRGDVFYWGSLMASALLASVPIVAVYSLLLENYVSGLTMGSVKG